MYYCPVMKIVLDILCAAVLLFGLLLIAISMPAFVMTKEVSIFTALVMSGGFLTGSALTAEKYLIRQSWK